MATGVIAPFRAAPYQGVFPFGDSYCCGLQQAVICETHRVLLDQRSSLSAVAVSPIGDAMQKEANSEKLEGREEAASKRVTLFDPWQQAFRDDMKRQPRDFDY